MKVKSLENSWRAIREEAEEKAALRSPAPICPVS
jgi:hypothetical protein